MSEVTMNQLRARQQKEVDEFIDNCTHNKVKVEDIDYFGKRDITIRCEICGLNLIGYLIDGEHSYLAYVRDCVKEYPGNVRKRREQAKKTGVNTTKG